MERRQRGGDVGIAALPLWKKKPMTKNPEGAERADVCLIVETKNDKNQTLTISLGNGDKDKQKRRRDDWED